ncbi:Putative zinc-binding oxidoreductase [Mycobacteroides abscessus subsp. abscessus]|nr:Putative zinc-binding oxidoreductase [Mycobacteroides abscessus subsp. abscessus]SIJ14884.1 Putative zinc-binding oxidoreductase [Mycobacteroides abscessus subsp. abscessus]
MPDPGNAKVMKAIVAEQGAKGTGLSLTAVPYPHAAENDVIVQVHAAGFTPGELDWPGTWADRSGRSRGPSIPGHEVSGVVVELGYGTTGLTVGQRVFGITDWTRNGALAQYVAVEARNLAPLSADVDHTVAAALPVSGLTAWQGLFLHGHIVAGQSVLIHGAAGAVGSVAVQLAHEAGAHVIGTGRGGQRDQVLGLKADDFVDLTTDTLEDVGKVDVVFDVIGGEILDRSAQLVRSGGALITIAEPPRVIPEGARAVFFVVEADRRQLTILENKLRDGRIRQNIGSVIPLEDALSAFDIDRKTPGKTIVQIAAV